MADASANTSANTNSNANTSTVDSEAAWIPPVTRAVFAAAERSPMTRNFVARSSEAQAGRTPAPLRADGD